MTDPYARLILDRLKDVHEDIAEIKAQVIKTNGRVDALERWKDRSDGAKAALGWVTPLLIALTTAVVTALLTYLLAV